jgi:4-hydroxybenzoate polyprenyltransferase
VLYAVPGFLGWQQASGRIVPVEAVVIAGLWTGAMHLFSAIPDIKSDREAGIATTATLLGFRGSLVCCAVLWLAFAVSLLTLDSVWPWALGLLVYPVVPVFLLFLGSEATTRVYWFFPAINSLLGMAGFFVIALSK